MIQLPEGTSAAQQRALQIGRAAEHLVVADLLLAGHEAFLTEAGMRYDIVAEVGGRLLRIQVKSTGAPRNVSAANRPPRIAYNWNVRSNGKGRRGRLTDEQCDLVALVALDVRTVAYLPVKRCGVTVYLDAPGPEGKRMVAGERYKKPVWSGTIYDYPLESALCDL